MTDNFLIDESTQLNTLPIPYLEVVLSEIFFILPKKCRTDKMAPYPNTVGKLALEANIRLQDLLPQLKSICSTSSGLGISCEVLVEKLTDSTIEISVVDLSPSPQERGKALKVEDANLDSLLKVLRTKDEVVCICDEGSKSYSGAMYLRSSGFSTAFYLVDGLSKLDKEVLIRLNKILN